MLDKTWYYRTIRKYVILFGTMMNDIRIWREDTDGNVEQYIKVPLSYGPKEKFLARLDSDPDLDREVAITLPRMAFEITSMSYDGTRKMPSIRRFLTQTNTDQDRREWLYNPVPYNFDISLYVMVKYVEDGTKILEQILPYFTPEFTNAINVVDDPAIPMDIPIILTSVSSEDTYEGDFDSRRAMIWTLNFTLKGVLFGPMNRSEIIRKAILNMRIPTTNTAAEGVGVTPVAEYVEITPGLDANGNPTTDPNNAINIHSVTSEDNYAYIIDFSGPIVEANT